jgi:shikimate kinase
MPAIVLVGPMGVGKTTIGKKLAKALGLPFIDTDQVFVKEYGAITNFFEQSGETAFRDLEETIVAQAVAQTAVVATGGGAVLSERTRTLLEESFVVYLETDGRHMASRLSGGGRPLLKNGLADWRRIYEGRKALYIEVANLTVDTSNTPLAKIIDQIREGVSRDERF